MARFDIFVASCVREGAAAASGPLPSLRFFRTQVRRQGDPWRDRRAYREIPFSRTAIRGSREDGLGAAGTDREAALSFFAAAFKAAQDQRGRGPAILIVHIHGFASTVPSAVARAAELADKYRPLDAIGAGGFKAPAVLSFHWPSEGETFSWDWKRPAPLTGPYRRDRDRARLSAPRLTEFLTLLAAYSQERRRRDRAAPRLALVAHSMGAWVLENAAPLFTAAPGGAPFDILYLMAPDCLQSALEESGRLAKIRDLSNAPQVFHAASDLPVAIAPKITDGQRRLGLAGPTDAARARTPSIGVVVCDAVSATFPEDFNHQYYRLRREVVAEARRSLQEATGAGGRPVPRLSGRRAVAAAVP